MSKLIRNWKELAEIPPNDKYKIEVDKKYGCSAWILPLEETEETKENYFEHHVYLSTHTFYGRTYEYSTKMLQKYGFNVEIDNWDKVGDIE